MLKRKVHKIFLVFQLFFVVTTGFPQQSVILDSFDAFLIDDQVYLDWVISAGNTCNGTKILRSTDSIHFIQIGSIEGICGSPNSPQPFNFTDENPEKNKINYYRLELGLTGFSETRSVEIIELVDDGYQVRPNPASTSTKIYFDNSSKEQYLLSLYSINGTLITTISTQENYFEVNVTNLPDGMYIFYISSNKGIYLTKGKFMVLR